MADVAKLGLVAGGGILPLRVIEARKRDRAPLHLIRINGWADEGLKGHPGVDHNIGEFGKIVASLKDAGCDGVCFAGVVRRPDFASLAVDLRGAMMLPKVIAAAAKGDGAILSAVVSTFEGEGFTVVGPDEVMGRTRAEAGALGRKKPNAQHLADIAKASALIDAIGPFDVAQGAVVSKGFVVAIEAAEGTDKVLQRCAEIGAPAKGGVLVKKPKPGQELRIDMPVIGETTIENAAAAGLDGIAVLADQTIMVDREAMRRTADRKGLFVYGYTDEELSGA